MANLSNVADYRIAFVAAQWHGDLVNVATSSCYSELLRLGIKVEDNVKLFKVPGSLELPLMSKLLARSGDWDTVINFGLVVDGGIYRHGFVAQAVISGLVAVALETEVPVLSVVLTPQRFNENDPKDIEFFRMHLLGKGVEAAKAAVGALQAVEELRAADSTGGSIRIDGSGE